MPEAEISLIIIEFKSKNSTDFDEISPILLKEVADLILNTLTLLVNVSFEQGGFLVYLRLKQLDPSTKTEIDKNTATTDLLH